MITRRKWRRYLGKKTSCILPSQYAAISEGTLVAPYEKTYIRKQEINTETRLSFYQDWGRLSTENVRKKLRINKEQDMSLFFPSNEKDKLPSAFMRKRKICFPTKLHQMLSDVDTEETISWLPHGRAWEIHSMKRFEDTTLKKYFPHCKLSSFMRLVNIWNFERVKIGPDKMLTTTRYANGILLYSPYYFF